MTGIALIAQQRTADGTQILYLDVNAILALVELTVLKESANLV
jgi:hypothetical protein